MKSVLIFILSFIVVQVQADSIKVIRSTNMTKQINATGGGVKCYPGIDRQHFGVPTTLHVDLDPDNHTTYNTAYVIWSGKPDFGDECAQFDVVLNASNPSWITLEGTVKVTEIYQTVFGNKCTHYFEEELKLKIKNTNYALVGSSRFTLGLTDGACQ